MKLKTLTLKPRHRIASEIQEIKLRIYGIKERIERYNFQFSEQQQQGLSIKYPDRLGSLFVDEGEIVGFEKPKDEIVGWLIDGEERSRSVISVVGMGGLGKTTLAKNVYDDQRVKGYFDCRAFLVVSQSYSVEALVRNMMMQFSEETKEPLPQGMF
jgi:disease resistance protein RPM1